MIRILFAVLLAVLTWMIVATLGNWILRAGLPGYTGVEKSMAFSMPMLLCRLGLGVIASLCAGAAVRAVARAGRPAVVWAAAILLLLFLPVHASIWNKFPVWYHLFFLTSLPACVLLGGWLIDRISAPRRSAPSR